MASYTPRSGAFRKVKYGLKIFMEDEIPQEDLNEVMGIAKAIKGDAEQLDHRYELEETKQRKKRRSGGKNDTMKEPAPFMKTVGRSRLTEANSGIPASLMQQRSLDDKENADVPGDEYDKLYPATVRMPKNRVKTSAEPESSDVDDLSDYDMDSEDEEWLSKNQDSNITPARLEYIFTQLNRRNTHVREKAIGALRDSYHEDFEKIFPYWKEKRLLFKNVSSFKLKKSCTRKEAKYYGTDPFLVFLAKPEKAVPTTPPKPQTMDSSKLAVLVARMLDRQRYLETLRAWALKQREEGENQRARIANNISQVKERYQSMSQEADSALGVDLNNNNTDSSFFSPAKTYDLRNASVSQSAILDNLNATTVTVPFKKRQSPRLLSANISSSKVKVKHPWCSPTSSTMSVKSNSKKDAMQNDIDFEQALNVGSSKKRDLENLNLTDSLLSVYASFRNSSKGSPALKRLQEGSTKLTKSGRNQCSRLSERLKFDLMASSSKRMLFT